MTDIVTFCGKPAFPLSLVWPRLTDYYLTSDFTIISFRRVRSGANKLLAQPRLLRGITSRKTGSKTYTLGMLTMSIDRIVRGCTSHKDYAKIMSSNNNQAEQVTTSEQGLPPGRTQDALEAVRGAHYVLATINEEGHAEFGTVPVFHAFINTAKEEAERVAKLTGNSVMVLQVNNAILLNRPMWFKA